MDEKCLITVKEKKSLDKIYLPFQYLPERGKKAFKQIFEYLNSQKTLFSFFLPTAWDRKRKKPHGKMWDCPKHKFGQKNPTIFIQKRGFLIFF